MQVVEATEEFVIAWPNPGMAESTWIGDRMHFPGPTVQFAQRLIGAFMEDVLSGPTVFANGFQFSTIPTIPDPPPEVVAGGLAVWHDKYAPRIQESCARVRATDFDAMSEQELAEALGPLFDEALEALRLTLVVVKQFMEPTFALLEFLEEKLGADGPVLGGTILQGFENATSDAGSRLEGLAALAARSAPLAEALKSGQLEIGDLDGGRELLDELAAFLDDFGWRVETWGSMQAPTWAEDPSLALAHLGRQLADPDSGSSAARSAEQRAAALAEVESRLDGESFATFSGLLERTPEHVAVSEDRARWQLTAIGVLRPPALALGRKLVAAGALDRADDIFYLTFEEAVRAAGDPGDWVRATAQKGAADFGRWEASAPPPFLGPPPDPSKFTLNQQQMMPHFFGVRMPSFDGTVIEGIGASRGKVTGTARVVRQLDESDKFEDGDILVCITTAPPWTVLIAVSSAVVTDTGGVMSHSAIVARELAIPCVVGTQLGTAVIPDGATITVDGEAGTVTVGG